MSSTRLLFVALFTVVLLMIFASPFKAFAQNFLASRDEVPTISAEYLQKLREQKADFFLLDVRTEEEYKMSHIEGAHLIPLNRLQSELDSLPENKKIIVYCHSGNRSRTAVSLLILKGFKDVASLRGGILAWDDLKP